MLIANRTGNGVAVSIIGEIMGENEWFASDAALFRAALDEAGDAPLDLWVSSSGGSLDAALAMRAMIEAYPGKVSINTAGVVASAATLLLCAPNAKVTAQRGSVFMVHQSRMVAEGDAAGLRKSADVLDTCDGEIVRVYRLRMACDDDRVRDMMGEETWLSPEEARELGLVDEIGGATSGGYIAEPKNAPSPSAAYADGVSARLAPKFEALQTGLNAITATGEGRVQAITNAATAAVAGISEAGASARAAIEAAGSAFSDSVSAESAKLRADVESYKAECASLRNEIKNLGVALTRAYALCGGDPDNFIHDEERRRGGFKLNV